jgi:hypothetical protein
LNSKSYITSILMIDAVAYPVFVSIKTTSFKKIPHIYTYCILKLNNV